MKRVYDHPAAQSSENVTTLMRSVTWCPDSKPVDDLLRQMQGTHSHLAVVDHMFESSSVVDVERRRATDTDFSQLLDI